MQGSHHFTKGLARWNNSPQESRSLPFTVEIFFLVFLCLLFTSCQFETTQISWGPFFPSVVGKLSALCAQGSHEICISQGALSHPSLCQRRMESKGTRVGKWCELNHSALELTLQVRNEISHICILLKICEGSINKIDSQLEELTIYSNRVARFCE